MQTSFGALFCLFYYQRYQNNPHLLTFIYNISATLGQNYLATRCHFDNSVVRFCNNINTEKYIRLGRPKLFQISFWKATLLSKNRIHCSQHQLAHIKFDPSLRLFECTVSTFCWGIWPVWAIQYILLTYLRHFKVFKLAKILEKLLSPQLDKNPLSNFLGVLCAI